jgi:hypothetical protein
MSEEHNHFKQHHSSTVSTHHQHHTFTQQLNQYSTIKMRSTSTSHYMHHMGASHMASPRMPAWDGPYKLMLKVLTASLKTLKAEKEGLLVYPIVEFQRSGSSYTRKVKGPRAKGSVEQVYAGGRIEHELAYAWPLDLYYGGEVIDSNRSGNDTLKVYFYSHEEGSKEA